MDENRSEKIKHQYCSQHQKDELVQLVTENSDLVLGKLTSKFTNKDAEQQWKIIASKLNSIPGGQKDWKQWRKTWQDIKSRTKSKKASLSRYERGTGGGPSPIGEITPVDEKVLSVINPTSIIGDCSVTESQIEFVIEDGDMETLPMDSTLANTDNSKFVPEKAELTETVEEKIKSTPRKRLSAANRLMTSAKATTALATLSQERLAFEKEKFEFEQKKFEFEKSYREKKLLIMKKQAEALEYLVTTQRK